MFTKARGVVEIGASHVAWARFERADRGRLRLLECAVERIDAGAIFEPAWRESVAGALQALRARTGAAGEVTVVLPPHLTLTKFVRVPRVDTAKLERIVQFEAQQAMPLALEELVWDSAAASEAGQETELMLSAVKRENVEALGLALDAAGFTARRMVPAISALLTGYRQAQPAEAPPTLLFDVGARSVVLLLIEARRFCGRSFALGGPAAVDQLTTEILALRLKQETTRTLVHFGRQTACAKPLRIVLTGGGAQVAGLADLAAEKFGLPVVALDLVRAVDLPASASDHAPLLVQLVGAAALEPGSGGLSAMDLRPVQQRSEEANRRRQPWLVAAGAVAALALLPPCLHYHAVAETALGRAAAMERELAPWRASEAVNRANLQKLGDTQRRWAELQRLVAGRSTWLGLLADLQDRLVELEDVWLDELKVLPAVGEAAPTRLAISGRLLDRDNPLGKAGEAAHRQLQRLLASIAASPFVTAVEGEHFDYARPGVLGFDCVVVANTAAGL